MALHTNFAVEAENEPAIRAISSRFSGLSFPIGETVVAIARAEVFAQNGLWYFFADPDGVFVNGSSILPSVTTEAALSGLRKNFYTLLLGASGFRRALFGYEALDILAGWSTPGGKYLFDFPDLILKEELIRGSPLMDRASPFSAGYLRIAALKEGAFGAFAGPG